MGVGFRVNRSTQPTTEGSLPTDEISAKFVLTHEMTHALEIGNPRTFKSYKENVSLPWSIFAGFSSTPIIKRNVNRPSLAREVFADTIPAYYILKVYSIRI